MPSPSTAQRFAEGPAASHLRSRYRALAADCTPIHRAQNGTNPYLHSLEKERSLDPRVLSRDGPMLRQTSNEDQMLRWRLFLLLGGVRPSSFARLAAAFSALAPPLRTIGGLPQRRNHRLFGDPRARLVGRHRLDWLRRRPCFHEFENLPPLGSQPPPAAGAFDQPLRPDVEIRNPRREAPSPIRPVVPAGRQDGHVPLEVFHRCKPLRVCHQDLKDCHLEVHARPSGSAPHRRRVR